jgi:hypothetical protein
MRSLFLSLSLFLGSVAYAQQVLSPDKNIKVVVKMQQAGQGGLGQPYFKVLYKSKGTYIEVLPASPLGISREDQQFVSNLKLIGESKPVIVHDKYEMLTGKRKLCTHFPITQTPVFQLKMKRRPM